MGSTPEGPSRGNRVGSKSVETRWERTRRGQISLALGLVRAGTTVAAGLVLVGGAPGAAGASWFGSKDAPLPALDSLAFVQPDALDKPIEFHYKVTDHGYAHRAGTLLLVRPRVVGTDGLPWGDKPRTVPIDLEATGRWHDSFDIALPAGCVVDELSDPVDMETDFASYHSKTTAAGSVLHYERDYVVRKVEIPASECAAFGELEAAIGEDEQAAAVLKKR